MLNHLKPLLIILQCSFAILLTEAITSFHLNYNLKLQSGGVPKLLLHLRIYLDYDYDSDTNEWDSI
jgi:hypothetical protein